MPTLTSNMWKGDVNTKVPALSHYFTYRITGANFAATASTNFALPGNYNLLGQYTPAQAPTNFAQTSSPYDVNSEPQFLGAVFVPTQLSVRNPNGTFTGSGGSSAGTATISLYNSNVAGVNNATGVVTRTAGSAPTAQNTYGAFIWTASAAVQPWSNEAFWTASIPPALASQGTAAAGLTTVASTVAESATVVNGYNIAPVRFGLGDQLAVNVTVAGYVAGTTPPNATQFTVDVFGYWLQGF